MWWISESKELPRLCTGLIQIYSSKTGSFLKSNETAFYAVRVVWFNRIGMRRTKLVKDESILLWFLPAETAELRVQDDDFGVDNIVCKNKPKGSDVLAIEKLAQQTF